MIRELIAIVLLSLPQGIDATDGDRRTALDSPFSTRLVSPQGPWEISKGAYRLRLSTRVGDRDYDAGLYLGYAADRVVKNLEIWYKQKPMIIPRSLFADIGTPRLVNLQAVSNRARLTIQGSDAGGSYECVMEFRSGEAVRRSVYDGESHKLMQRTTYSY